ALVEPRRRAREGPTRTKAAGRVFAVPWLEPRRREHHLPRSQSPTVQTDRPKKAGKTGLQGWSENHNPPAPKCSTLWQKNSRPAANSRPRPAPFVRGVLAAFSYGWLRNRAGVTLGWSQSVGIGRRCSSPL